jgi:predicted N-formylglutamate amidohydrolase
MGVAVSRRVSRKLDPGDVISVVARLTADVERRGQALSTMIETDNGFEGWWRCAASLRPDEASVES